ncbi:aminodeoxychorismate lyase [Cnuibacter physcomitrellae]|uniref:aminodeoxychorismate lyase n=1 Tax=Cnuibacter physcomitrellae TaxID=1619308 RepID=UPI00217585B4|nr:aminodeoxychorismate lyase [Cnuibacter physcomitrellae]MCS5496643.1 aminodeoxychorismate lyase [Cnuibacter physcomitrellae]
MPSPVLVLVNSPVLPHDDSSSRPAIEIADPTSPHVSVLDLGVTRGDGIFETIMVTRGEAPAIDAHLARFASSAALLDLPEPDPAVWREAVALAMSSHPTVDVLAVKLVLTRGMEGTGVPTAWALAMPTKDFSADRETGIRVVALDRGYRHDVAQTSPWLLQGAKTLSYAINSAALREAGRRGADDVIFTSSDGFVLEAPTASVLLRHGDRILTPPTEHGILHGTTQRRAFEFFAARGYVTRALPVTRIDLERADAVWLASSIRQAVPVVELDGRPLQHDLELTRALNAHLSLRDRD